MPPAVQPVSQNARNASVPQDRFGLNRTTRRSGRSSIRDPVGGGATSIRTQLDPEPALLQGPGEGLLRSLGGGFAEGGDFATFGEPLERACLDLPNTFARQAERTADLLE
jgi:hypothetical protein